MDLYGKGTRVWVPDREQVWVGGNVVGVVEGESVEVQCEGEEGTRVLKTESQDSLPLLRNPEMLIGANNLTTLSYLHEPAVLHNLSVRFLHSNMIYTYCGIVLVALNPYQSLPIYGNETATAYRGRDLGEMDPHVFAVAEEAFRSMTRNNSNQSLIISGESGAGKTVSAKFVMRYFATVGGASTETKIEKKVLASNPIMEAIGNAKTTRNDNSSRFGKYIEIRFDKESRITGAHMRTYLLERSRVVTQATNERNYHIFYQLCAAREDPDMAEYQLDGADAFHYLSQGECVAINDVDDYSEFTATKEALTLLGFHDNQLRGVFRVLAAILHLGNVTVGRRAKGGEVMSVIGEDDSYLVTSATLLGIDPAHLAHWLSHRKITTSREVYHKPLTYAQSTTARDSLAKSLYSTLFDWIVNIINSSLGSTSSRSHTLFIGVLDIYGFEVFDVNTFEQFCINYANEKLQQQFNMHVFQLEQTEYMKEEIEWSFIDYYDNQPCIDLIENRLGVLDLLDETCKMPGGCDPLFTQKLYDNHNSESSTHFTKPRMSQSAFQIKHYAGPVQYQTSGFVEKNSEQVAEEYLHLLNGSTVPFLCDLYKPVLNHTTPAKPAGGSRTKKGGGVIAKATVGSQFRSSLHGLMTTLNSTTPHYIRCIKSNDRKLPFVFEPQRAVQQLRACGVLETVRLSAAGYPSRWTYNEFFQRYRLLLRSGQVRRDDVRQMCEYILHRSIKDSSQYRFGKTKLFFRAGQVAYLERLRSQRLYEASVCLQCHVRGWTKRRWYGKFRTATVGVQARARGLLARRLAVCLRQTRAAVCIQRHTRGLVARLCYLKLRKAVVTTQALFRGRQARKLCLQLLCDRKATVLQKCVRGWLARRHYARQLRCIVQAQCCVRRWAARRELRRLRLEARSVTHLQSLNKGLELKVIELQLKLVEKETERQTAQEQWNRQKCSYEEALSSANAVVERLQSELALERQSAHNAGELPAASPHSEPKNGSMEREPEQQHSVEEKPDKQQNSMEQGPEPHHGMEQRPDHYGAEQEDMKHELEKLHKALCESKAECSKLREKLSALQREFISEEPTPPPPLPASTGAQPVSEKTSLDDFLLSPPSSDTLASAMGEVPSIILLPPLPAQLTNGPCSSTPDMQCESTGINPGVKHHVNGMEISQTLSQLGSRDNITGQDSSESGQASIESEHDVGKSGQNISGLDSFKSGQNNIFGLDSFKSGQSSIESGHNVTDELEFLQELVDQLEREKHKLMQGNIEICQELSKVDASKTATVSTLKKIAQENSFLRKELAVVREKEENGSQKKDHEMQCLMKKVTTLKQALQQSSSTTSLNASLQQEVARLTEENLSLLETVEELRRDRSGYRTPMSPRRRITPCGAESPRGRSLSSAKRMVTFSLSNEASSQHLSPWRSADQSKLIRDLVLDLKPEQVSGDRSCVPGHMIFMGLRYCHHMTGGGQVLAFMDEVVTAIQQVVQASSTQFSTLSFWLANICHLISILQLRETGQTSSRQTGFKVGLKPSMQAGPAGILTSDLSVRTDKLEALGQSTFRDLFQLIHNRIQPLIVPGVLEYESIPNISSVKPILGCHIRSHDPNITITTVTRELSSIFEVLRKHHLTSAIIGALMKQTFFMINAFLLNNLLLRRDMCHWSKGIQIRYNLSQLEDWAREHGLSGYDVISQLLPSVQAAKLLQMKKSTAKDAEAICEHCTHLNPLQVQKLLTMYSPANDFEERVPASVIRLVAQKNGADTADPVHLMVNIDHFFPVTFPSTPSDINYNNLSLPPSLNHLTHLLSVH